MNTQRSAPLTNLGRRNKNRAIARVARNQRNRVENKMHYQSSREWASFQTDGAVTKRRMSIASAVPALPFVEGIIHKDHPVDGLDAGKTCSCA